jgi:glucosamine kinase
MGREALRRSLWVYDGRAEETELTTAILNRFEWDPTKIVSFASKATAADYARFAPLILHYAAAADTLATALVEEAAVAAIKIIERLLSAGAPAVSLVGGLAEPLTPWLPVDIRSFIRTPKSDPADGAILMARRAFFKLDSVTLRAG